jgi:hypothetical protein
LLPVLFGAYSNCAVGQWIALKSTGRASVVSVEFVAQRYYRALLKASFVFGSSIRRFHCRVPDFVKSQA